MGFRPFVWGVATRLALAGFVGNDSTGVVVEAEGPAGAVGALVDALAERPPPLARVDEVVVTQLPPLGAGAAGGSPARGVFVIAESLATVGRLALVAPDVATCDACAAELADPADRRHRHPFLSCTDCGPRFTIVTAVPYDRACTTMAGFGMCARCAAEFADPADRRFHAQPICCPDCGPVLRCTDAAGADLPGDPITAAADRLRAGAVLAVKGLGGYHLAVAAADQAAVSRLRERKHRAERPFALLVADLAAAGALAEIDSVEAALLTSPARPIVLLRRRPGAPVADAVAPAQRELGLLLPYTPVHHLLTAAMGAAPLVLTSGNRSEEPIAHEDGDARDRLAGIADAFLTHDRPIHTRVDDSVARVVRGAPMLLRRSRGYAPLPVALPWKFPRPVLACGPELKNTFCLGADRHAFVSHHVGDLENYETFAAYLAGIGHFRRLFEITEAVVAHDLHPEYLATKHAHELAAETGAELVGVQHHHAHIASCLADNGVAGPVVGVAFDGLGYGQDGTLWGGEFLVADLVGFRRAAHLEPVPMPGGAAAVRQPWRMAASYLDAALGPAGAVSTAVARRQGERWGPVLAAARAGVNAPLTSSVGRLFDAVAAVLGVRDAVTYEGQAAIELEQLADPAAGGTYAVGVTGEPYRVCGADLVRSVVEDAAAGTPRPVVAARFHQAVADVVADVCSRIRADGGPATAALSGGVFQNVLLLERTRAGLAAAGFEVLVHRQVPPNDGGVSLGQAAVAAARDRAG